MLASQDGYCSIVAFDAGELGEPLPADRQPVLPAGPLYSLAPSAPSSSAAPVANSSKREIQAEPEKPSSNSTDEQQPQPKAKKRRIALTTKALDEDIADKPL